MLWPSRPELRAIVVALLAPLVLWACTAAPADPVGQGGVVAGTDPEAGPGVATGAHGAGEGGSGTTVERVVGSTPTPPRRPPPVLGPPTDGVRRLQSAGVPELAARAYLNASLRVSELDRSCRVPAEMLAAVGAAESRHGTITEFDAYGTTVTVLRGYATTGDDSDGGRLDGDPEADWAVGPMQFTPPTWEAFGRDGDGDGTASPSSYWDASLGAAAYLCHFGGYFLDPWFVASQWAQWEQSAAVAHQRFTLEHDEWARKKERRELLLEWVRAHPSDAQAAAAELAAIGEVGPEPKEPEVPLPSGPAQVEAAARGYYGTPGPARDDYLRHVVAAYRSIAVASYGVIVSESDRFPPGDS